MTRRITCRDLLTGAVAAGLATAVAFAADPPGPDRGVREALVAPNPVRTSEWRTHRTLVILTLAALATQTTLILLLLCERRRRQRAQQLLRRLSAHVILCQEHTFGRISHELHDHLNQQVALAAIELDNIAKAPGADLQRVRAVADELRALGLELHAAASQLRPTEIEYIGLVPVVRALAEKVGSRSSIAVEVVDEGWPASAPLDASTVLYRVAQEALHNAVKHSGAATVRLTVSGTPKSLSLTVADDGRGFDPTADSNTPRLGLAGMRERLWLLGGSLVITSGPSRGTRLEAKIPLPITQPHPEWGADDDET